MQLYYQLLMGSNDNTYKSAGIDIDQTDAAKREMAESLKSKDPRIISRMGGYAALFEAKFPGVNSPVLVLKIEEPGSKQLLALQSDRIESLCADLINHLINDIIVVGAEPLAVLDTIICSTLEKDRVVRLVKGMSEACNREGCSLVGGETSVQPKVLEAGRYVLAASIVGVVDKSRIIDGSAVLPGDVILGLESSGPHTNGYTLIRKLMDQTPDLAQRKLGNGQTFFDAIMAPHRCYRGVVKSLTSELNVHSIAHITGGGIRDNLARVLPSNVSAHISLKELKPQEVFSLIANNGKVPEEDMLRTFNMGIGLVVVLPEAQAKRAEEICGKYSLRSLRLGLISSGSGEVLYHGQVSY